MNRPIASLAALALCAAAAPLALAPGWAVPLAAQQSPGSFTLPDPTPTPSPAPAGPADERAGVPIPPRTAPSAPAPAVSPPAAANPAATPAPRPLDLPPPRPTSPPARETAGPARAEAPAAAPSPQSASPAETSPAAAPGTAQVAPADLPPVAATPVPAPAAPGASAATDPGTDEGAAAPGGLPAWWPYAAGALGALAAIGGAVLLRRRRKPGSLRLAAPSSAAAGAAGPAPDASEPPRLDLTLEITSAIRSVMMFTVEYRLTIANRSDRAVNDVKVAVQLACARASAAAGAPSPGAAQALGEMARIGPHQARSISGTLQLPLSAIQPLRQGRTPLFVPLAHVTLDAAGVPGLTRSFVIGSPSGAGRVHPVPLDQPPGAVPGLVAQPIAIPPVSAAA